MQKPDSNNDYPAARKDDLEPFIDDLRQYFPTREEVLAEARQQVHQQSRRRQQMLGSLALLLVAAVGLGVLDPAWQTRTLVTRAGELRILDLPDGSQVAMNSGTRLNVEKRLRSRRFELLAGEATFTVEPGWRPFIVRSQGVDVLDIGTVFNLYRHPDGLRISVLEGEVEISNEQGKRRLTENQQVQASRWQIGPTRAFDPRAIQAWQQGVLYFDGTPLHQVVEELQRHASRPLRLIADETTRNLRLSGEYAIAGGMDALLETLTLVMPLEIRQELDGSILLTQKH